jgi:hypothetical protein
MKLSSHDHQISFKTNPHFKLLLKIGVRDHSAPARVLLTYARLSKHKQHLWLVSGLRSLHRLAIHYAMHISWAFELVEIAYFP